MRAPILAVLLLLAAGLAPALAQDAAAPAPAPAAAPAPGPAPVPALPQKQDADTLDPIPQGSLNPQPLPPLENPNARSTPAKELFGRKMTPYPGPPLSIGGYADGCLAGGVALPITGPAWQVMRLSRNRNWGNPELIAFLERFGANAQKVGWNGLLVGDMAQPRGGPMITGHDSHQIGLDADIWFMPMPDHVQTPEEREMNGAVDMVAPDRLDVDPKVWTHTRTELIRSAAEDPEVTRIFVNAAIKKALCREAGTDRGWLAKVRPWWGHAEHFHIRLACPLDSTQCKSQPPVPDGDGCGHALDFWFRQATLHPAPPPSPAQPKPGVSLAALPAACKQIVMAP
jgi:penicillin-insensitive murein DD-endopeptidase